LKAPFYCFSTLRCLHRFVQEKRGFLASSPLENIEYHACIRTRKLPSLEREWVVGQSLRPCLSNSLVQPFIQRNSSVSMNPTKPIHCIAEKTGFGRDGDSALQPVRAFVPVAERSAYVPRSFMIQFQESQPDGERARTQRVRG